MRTVWRVFTALLFSSSAAPADAAIVGYDKVVAFIVGVSSYRQSPRFKSLPNARPDAEAFARLMRSRRFSGKRTQVFTLYDREATEKEIIRTFQKALRAARSERSLMVFYFAGHGGVGAGGHGYIVPYGAIDQSEFLSMAILQDLAGPDNGVKHQLFILGSCFAGSLVRSDAPPPKEQLSAYDEASRWFDKALKSRARVAIMAGGNNETLPDGPPGTNSRFGRSIVDALSSRPGQKDGLAQADFNRDGCVMDLELASYVRNHGKVAGYNSPHFGALAYHDSGAAVGFCRPLEAAAPLPTLGIHRGRSGKAAPLHRRPEIPSISEGIAIRKVTGLWEGTLDIGHIKDVTGHRVRFEQLDLPITIELEREGDSLIGTFTGPLQIPCSKGQIRVTSAVEGSKMKPQLTWRLTCSDSRCGGEHLEFSGKIEERQGRLEASGRHRPARTPRRASCSLPYASITIQHESS